MITVGDLVEDGRRRLAGVLFAPPLREARLLAARVLDSSEAHILAHPESPVPAAKASAYERLLRRRLEGEPVAYLLGEKEFYGRSFFVDRRALIPRPETEHLVEAALPHLRDGARILDVGTGSGCIALTLALERPTVRVLATDRSAAALQVAARNRRRFGLEDRVRLLAADLLQPLRLDGVAVVLANLPYVDPAEAALLSPEVTRFEPATALFADAAGTGLLERLVAQAAVLDHGTRLLLELGMGQRKWLEERARASELELVAVHHDYARIARVAELRRR